MMMSENLRIHRPENISTFLETQHRNRRLADIKRGQAYFQKIDSLAEKQWYRNAPHDSAGRRQIVSIRPLTDTRHTQSYARSFMPKHGTENKRIHSERPRGSDRIDELLASNSTTPRQKIPLEIRDQLPPYFRNGFTEKIDERLGVYNKWGSGVHPLDEKTALRDSDMTPSFEPFRFRDSVKHVYKPSPKHYLPMSRAGHDKERHLKVHTNFLSRNGVIDVIPELDQWPDIENESRQQSFIREPELLQKEKTAIFLNRLDKIIDPFKQRTDNVEITTSDEECKGSPPPSISELSELDMNEPRSSKSREASIVQKLPLYPKYITHAQKIRKKNLTFSKFLLELDRQPMGSSRKCKIWVNSLERVNSKNVKM